MLEYRWHWDSGIDVFVARRLLRRPLTDADLAPPQGARSWESWGVAPAAIMMKSEVKDHPNGAAAECPRSPPTPC
jgi:hypothetical protein